MSKLSDRHSMFVLRTILCAAASIIIAAAEPKYENDFEKAEVGSMPEDFLVLDGNFSVKEQDGNRFLELPGAPLDSFGLLFGPTARENVTVSARFYGEARGRRLPTFDVGLNGVGGYRLRVSPGKKQLELVRNDEVKEAIPFEWTPGKWTHLKLTVLKNGESEWTIQGSAWQEGQPEPKTPMVTTLESDSLPSGRASVFGSPFSGRPIRFDDFKVSPAG